MNYESIIKQHFPAAENFENMSSGYNSGVVKFKDKSLNFIFKKNKLWPTTESEVFFLQTLQKLKITPKVYIANFQDQYHFQSYVNGTTDWKELPLENRLTLLGHLGELTANIHSIDLGNNAGEFKQGYFEYKTTNEFIISRLDWILELKELEMYIHNFKRIIKFLKDYFNENLLNENVLLHGDLYLANTLHSEKEINAIIDPGEFRSGSRYLDIGTIHAQQPQYEDGAKLFTSFINGYLNIYTGKLDLKLINLFSAFWDLRSYRRLLVEHPDRFDKWFNNTYDHLEIRLKTVGYN